MITINWNGSAEGQKHFAALLEQSGRVKCDLNLIHFTTGRENFNNPEAEKVAREQERSACEQRKRMWFEIKQRRCRGCGKRVTVANTAGGRHKKWHAECVPLDIKLEAPLENIVEAPNA